MEYTFQNIKQPNKKISINALNQKRAENKLYKITKEPHRLLSIQE